MKTFLYSQVATKHYIGGIEYVLNAAGDFYVVEAIYHLEGRLTPMDEGNYNEWRAEYTLKDHLCNARVTFADLDNSREVEPSEILQTQHYYPFGMLMEGKGATFLYRTDNLLVINRKLLVANDKLSAKDGKLLVIAAKSML